MRTRGGKNERVEVMSTILDTVHEEQASDGSWDVMVLVPESDEEEVRPVPNGLP